MNKPRVNLYLVYSCVILALLSPLLFLLGSYEWLYSPIIFSDAYIDHTFSFFYDMGHFKTDYYKAARVPWVAPLFYLQKTVGPYLLSPFLTLLSAVTLPSLYFLLLKNLFGLRKAFVILPWIIFFPALYGLAAGGILYNNTAAILYLLTALVLWSLPEENPVAEKKKVLLALMTGALAMSAFHTNVIYIHLFILFPVIDLFRLRAGWLKRYLFFVIGAVLVTFFWGWINSLHGRPFWFFLSTFKTSQDLILNPVNQQMWYKPLHRILFLSRFEAFHLIFYISAYLSALFVLIKESWLAKKISRDIFAWSYLALFSLWIFWHAIGQTALTPPDFSYPLQVAGFLMLANWLREKDLSKSDVIFFVVSSVFLFACLFYSNLSQTSLIAAGKNSALLLTFMMSTLLVSVFMLPKKGWGHLGYLIAIGLLFSITSYKQLSDESPNARADLKCHYRQESYTAMMNIMVNLKNISGTPSSIVYMGSDEPVPIHDHCFYSRFLSQQEFAKLASLMAGESLSRFGRLREPEEFTAEHFRKFKIHRNPKLVIFTFRNPGVSERILKKAAEFGYEFRFNAEYSEQVAGHRIPYEIYDLVSSPPLPKTQ